MKKILLSVIALFVAISMNAEPYKVKTGDMSLVNSSNWGGHWYAFAEEGTEGNFDASAYEYVWIKFSGNTGNFRFGITYNEYKDWQDWGATYYDAYAENTDASKGFVEGYAFIKLEKEKAYESDVNKDTHDKIESPYKGDTWDKHVQNVFTQDNGTEMSVTVEGIWFGTAAELEAILGGGGEEGGEEGGETPEPAPTPSGWADVVLNGDCEGEDAGCLLSKNGDDTENFKWNPKEGAGVDGSTCATVYATGAAANEWDAQFFIYAKDHIFKAGEKFKFSMMIKADKEAKGISAQAHTTPGSYLHYTVIGGPIDFTTEWAPYTFEGEIPAEAEGMQTIAFNLNQDKTLENNYYFDNIIWQIEGGETAIQNVKAATAKDGVRYNLAGQKVNASYKGVVIMNGKKFLQK